MWYTRTALTMRQTPLEVEIPRGASLRTVIAELERAGLDVRRREFVLLVRGFGRERDIKAGNYLLAKAPTPLELLDKLTRGDVQQAEVRLIEGWTFTQFRDALDTHPGLRHDTKGLGDAELLKRLQAPEPHPEGLFFPDTYLFDKGTGDLEILRQARTRMKSELAAAWDDRADDLPIATPYEALILASIVEKETALAEERARIGGVFVERLRLGMRLQTDPTVIYGIGPKFDGNLRRSDLERDGPYNTYVRAGLPPTPIALPGAGALRAAVQPDERGELYFVATGLGDGSHKFSKTHGEHERAVAEYLGRLRHQNRGR